VSQGPVADDMRRYWDERARENAAYYVDTTCDYETPDMDRFFETGRGIVDVAFVEASVKPERRELAVEIGPGLGRVCKALAPHFEQVVGIDISTEMVERARELVVEPNVRFEVGDGVTLNPITEESADLVVTFTVLQHLTSRDAVAGYLREAARILRPGGVLAAQWNGDAHPRRYRMRTYWWKVRQQLFRRQAPDHRLQPAFLGTPVPIADVRRVLGEEGLQIEATKDVGTLFSWVWARKQ
jgi:SAM-dependent methyltransferase